MTQQGRANSPDTKDAAVRIDRWLWAARLYKTRSLATAAVRGGRVHVNGQRVKAAHPIRVGDRIELTRGAAELELIVAALSERRGPAPVAQRLYAETEQSVQRRKERQTQRAALRAGPSRRPDKKGRRQLRRLRRGE